MDFEIIDFHTHPFPAPEYNICCHRDYCAMTPESTRTLMQTLGISRFCGSVIRAATGPIQWRDLRELNDHALALADYSGGAYIPGFHVHPSFVRESCEEIERMSRLGVRLIGELVPYPCYSNWPCAYDDPAFSEILDCAEQYGMVVSFHSMNEDAMDRMVQAHPNLTFVAAHPGEYGEFSRHMERMRMSDRYFLDLSGTGIFRYGMIRHAIDLFGAERLIFGSDYPTCSPAMFVGAVALDPILTDSEREKIFSGNARRLLGLS